MVRSKAAGLGALAGVIKIIVSALSDKRLYSNNWVAVLVHAMLSVTIVIPVFILCFVWILPAKQAQRRFQDG